jgi:hypothetical protein
MVIVKVEYRNAKRDGKARFTSEEQYTLWRGKQPPETQIIKINRILS